MEQFDYSSFFVDRKVVTLGEIQQYFGFLYLGDIRKIVDNILAFEGDSKIVQKSTDTITLTPTRVKTILGGIQKWQLEQEEIIIKTSKQKGKLPKKQDSMCKLNGLRMRDLLSIYPNLSISDWHYAVKVHGNQWFSVTRGSSRTDTVYYLKQEFFEAFKDLLEKRRRGVFVNDTPTLAQRISGGGKLSKNTRSI